MLLQMYESTKEYVNNTVGPTVQTARNYVEPAVQTAKNIVEPIVQPAVEKAKEFLHCDKGNDYTLSCVLTRKCNKTKIIC